MCNTTNTCQSVEGEREKWTSIYSNAFIFKPKHESIVFKKKMQTLNEMTISYYSDLDNLLQSSTFVFVTITQNCFVRFVRFVLFLFCFSGETHQNNSIELKKTVQE